MKLAAPAKINLTLEVLKRRDDGYHEIRSILQTIDLCDELELEKSKELEFFCNSLELNNEDNLAIKASRLLRRKAGVTQGARISLRKRIPVAAGLGGGSSDAASVLKGLNILWGLKLSEAELMEISAGLGSDVPFFIQGGAALARGRGEIIEPLPSPGDYWFVLLMPPVDEYADKTSRMYRNLREADYTDGSITRSLAGIIKSGDEIGQSLLYNVFDKVAPGIYPQLPFFQEVLADASGTARAHLSGSGPCIYVMLKDEAGAKRVRHTLIEKKHTVYLAKILAKTAPAL